MSQQAPKRFLITEALAQSILNYLTEKPFKESAMLIQNLQRLEPYAEPKEVEAPPVPEQPTTGKKPKEHKEPPKEDEKTEGSE